MLLLHQYKYMQNPTYFVINVKIKLTFLFCRLKHSGKVFAFYSYNLGNSYGNLFENILTKTKKTRSTSFKDRQTHQLFIRFFEYGAVSYQLGCLKILLSREKSGTIKEFHIQDHHHIAMQRLQKLVPSKTLLWT